MLLSIPDFAGNHNGGMIEFGTDGKLYIGTGDGGGGGDPMKTGQNPNALLGKMLRLDVDKSYRQGVRNSERQSVRVGGGAPEVLIMGCAIRGAGRSIARPAICISAMSARTRSKSST